MGKVQDHKRSAKSKRQVDTTRAKAARPDRFEIEGVVEECLPNTMFRVKVTESEVEPMIGRKFWGRWLARCVCTEFAFCLVILSRVISQNMTSINVKLPIDQRKLVRSKIASSHFECSRVYFKPA